MFKVKFTPHRYLRFRGYFHLPLLFLLLLAGCLLFLRSSVSKAHANWLTPTAETAADLKLLPEWAFAGAYDSFEIAWGDVDGDGDLDAAVANRNEPNAVYYNDGGILQTADEEAWLSDELDYTNSVAWGDVDGDGDLDLAVGNRENTPNKLYINHDGILETAASWSSADSSDTLQVAWADVNGDGYLDLAAANWETANRVYFNNNGVLQTAAGWQSNDLDTSSGVAWGDVDLDGDLDLAVSNDDSPNKLYRNDNGSLTVNAIWVSNDTDDSVELAWGDVNNDGYPDLGVANSGGDSNKLYLNTAGTLGTDAVWGSNDSDYTTGIAWADVDGDGDLDFTVSNRNDGANKVYLNDNGTLPTNNTGVWFSSDDDGTHDIAWADFDGDGDLDLTSANIQTANRIYVNRTAAFQTNLAANWQNATPDRAGNVAWGDVDGDGDLDLAISGVEAPNHLYENVNGILQTTPVWSSNDNDPTLITAWGDVDNDGDLDLAAANLLAPNKLYLNVNGTLQADPVWSSADSDETVALAWGDVDGDGDLDLAVGNRNTNASDKIYLNNNGTLQTTAGWTSNDNTETRSIAWGDADNDGDLDLATGNTRGANYVFFNENGILQNNPAAVWSSEDDTGTHGIAWGDFDGDGWLDLAASNWNNPNVIYPNENGGLQNSADKLWFSSDTEDSTDINWGDADNDGDLDLAVANTSNGDNKVYLNENGVIQREPELIWFSNDTTTSSFVAWGDADGDGDLDLAAANGDSDLSEPNEVYYNTRFSFDSRQPNSNPLVKIQQPEGQPAADYYATANILEDQIIDFTYTLYDNELDTVGRIKAFYSLNGGGQWFEAVPTAGTAVTNLTTYNQPGNLAQGTHTFSWDTFASGFFGQSDNVVLRLEAYPRPPADGTTAPDTISYIDSTGTPTDGRPYTAATTFPFRARGTQVKVVDNNNQPVAGAIVYHSANQEQATLIGSGSIPYVTDQNGFLTGRGVLTIGDRLIALRPLSTATLPFTDKLTLYNTSAAPITAGLNMHTITTAGVQELKISGSNKLILFDLDISLEWDARHDTTFLNDLENSIQRASEVLYDVSNGQIALGQVRIHHNKEKWLSSDVVIYARNNFRPRASQGGLVNDPLDDTGADGLIPEAFYPGQVSLGPIWDPFGENQFDLGQDWWRALAHELAHYLLFLPDNYIGIGAEGLTAVDCQGSFMTNTYDETYSEFLTKAQWDSDPVCLQTIAEQLTGRSDWETIQNFYPMLNSTPTNPGPSSLPLGVTTVEQVWPDDPAETIPVRNIDLRLETNGQITLAPLAQAFLIQTQNTATLTDDRLISLGGTRAGGDRIKLRGANPGDELCVFDLQSSVPRLGCETVSTITTAVYLSETADWQPDITVSPVSSTTLDITVELPTAVSDLNVQVYPATGDPDNPEAPLVAPTAAMNSSDGLIFTRRITLANPAFNGHVRIWVPGSSPFRAAVSEFTLDVDTWAGASKRAWAGASKRAWAGASKRAWAGAPTVASDGQFTVLNLDDLLAQTQVSIIQTVSSVPNVPLWLTPIGTIYQVQMQDDFDNTVNRSISFDYLQSEVPDGYEDSLSIYHFTEAQGWQRLPTELDEDENRAVSQMPTAANGFYLLMATVELPAFDSGWNIFGYPVSGSRPVAAALASIEGDYSAVYSYDSLTDRWLLYDVAVLTTHTAFAPYLNDLEQLEFGRGYWLHANRPTTAYIGIPRSSLTTAAPPFPPATYYGPVLTTAQFTPAVGMPVVATIDGVTCGQSTVESFEGALVYKIQVAADMGDGCGQDGRDVMLTINGRPAVAQEWDNRQANYLPLSEGGRRIYLPLTTRP